MVGEKFSIGCIKGLAMVKGHGVLPADTAD